MLLSTTSRQKQIPSSRQKQIPSSRLGIPSLLFAITLWALTPLSPAAEALVLKAWGHDGQGRLEIPSSLADVTKLSAGGAHALALKSDGTVVAWGYNNRGQSNVPSGLNQVIALSAGAGHSLVLKSDGSLLAWGWNGLGQTTIPPEAIGMTAIAQGASNHNLAIHADQTVLAWGWNDEGQITVPDGLSGVTAVAIGSKHSLALKSDGTVIAWGWNKSGQSTVPAGLTNVVAISAGASHSLALKGDGTVTAWGSNIHGVRTVPTGLSGVVKISASSSHNTAIKSDGTIVQWGSNFSNQTTVPGGLANSAAITDPTKTMVVSGPSFNIAQYSTTLFDVSFSAGNHGVISAGSSLAKTPHSEAAIPPTIRADIGWHFTGWNVDISNITSDLTATAEYEVKPLVTFVAAPHGTITSGVYNQYLVSGTDAVAPVVQSEPGWRFIEWDQAFTAITENTTITAVYELMPLVTFSALPHGAITAGEASQFILLGADAIAPTVTTNEGWHFIGWDVPFTSVTNNLAVTARYIPDPTVTFATGTRGRITSGAAGQQVDYGTRAIAPVITPDPGWRFTRWDTEFSTVTMDITATALYEEWDIDRDALDDAWEKEIIDADPNDEFITIADVLPEGNPDGDHYTNLQEYERGLNPWVKDALDIHFWGDHRFPVTLSDKAKMARSVLDISQGKSHSLALLSDGQVISWNPDGADLPIIANLSGAIAISAGENHKLALRSNGTVIAWGDNTFQQADVPQGLNNVIKVSAGDTHSLALKSDGTVVAWGNPADQRTTIPSSLTDVVAISAGGSHSLALKADGTVVAWGANFTGQITIPPGLDRVIAISAGTSHSLEILNVRRFAGLVVVGGSLDA